MLCLISPAGCADGCPAALLQGTLVRAGDELVVATNVGGSDASERLRWPAGYRVEEHGGRLVAVDVFGSIKASEGDSVRLGGGERDGAWGVCGLVETVPPG